MKRVDFYDTLKTILHLYKNLSLFILISPVVWYSVYQHHTEAKDDRYVIWIDKEVAKKKHKTKTNIRDEGNCEKMKSTNIYKPFHPILPSFLQSPYLRNIHTLWRMNLNRWRMNTITYVFYTILGDSYGKGN